MDACTAGAISIPVGGGGVGVAHGGGGGDHHYATDAAKIVERCRTLLRSVLAELDEEPQRWWRTWSGGAGERERVRLGALDDVLICAERLVHTRLLQLLDREIERLSESASPGVDPDRFFGEHVEFPALADTIETLREANARNRGCPIGTNNGVGRKRSTLPHSAAAGSPRRRKSPSPSLCPFDDPIEDGRHGGSAGEWYYGGVGVCPPASPRAVVDNRDRHPLSIDGVSVPSHSSRHKYHPSRSAEDTCLFRLVVALQLCLVRISEADAVLCDGRASAAVRKNRGKEEATRSSFELGKCSSDDASESSVGLSDSELPRPFWRQPTVVVLAAGGTIGFGTAFFFFHRKRTGRAFSGGADRWSLVESAGKIPVGLCIVSAVRRRWRIACANARLANSAASIEDWIFRWICLAHNRGGRPDDDRFRRRRRQGRGGQPEFWYSNGALRFQLMKRGMDLLYASVGKAVEVTRGQKGNDEAVATVVESESDLRPSSSSSSAVWMSVVAALAASYYNVVGPASKSAQVVSSSSSSVLQNAWGMVGHPAVKKASLEATRILKGAAIADRVEVEGVPCFALSREAFPALASALRRHRRRRERADARLSTIHEHHGAGTTSPGRTASNDGCSNGYPRRDVVLHLAGGGFFAHTIAGDLPYVLDWSAATGAVVIVPEYALLPYGKFPDALADASRVYCALRSGRAAAILGFQPGRVVVTGESVGGNLAAALCVQIAMDVLQEIPESCIAQSRMLVRDQNEVRITESTYAEEDLVAIPAINADTVSLPDALMICCPTLNMSLDPTPSRIEGANDPVLPNGLFAFISNSYLPPAAEGGIVLKTHPLASPYYASDALLRLFPPTLIFTGSEDPFLDEAVHFNARLRSIGVRSSLRAVHNMPHAFWALATAGIPEARQVQAECQRWLKEQFRTRE